MEEKQGEVLSFLTKMDGWEMEEERRKTCMQPFGIAAISARFEELIKNDQDT
jgi:hypothetical protein